VSNTLEIVSRHAVSDLLRPTEGYFESVPVEALGFVLVAGLLPTERNTAATPVENIRGLT